MFRRFLIFLCLLTFFPAAVGAQNLAFPGAAQPALELNAQPTPPPQLDLSAPMPREEPMLVAASHLQGEQMAEGERPRKTHRGLTFQEFCEVHFGEHRWIYWAAAVAGIVAIHVVAD